MRFRFRPLLPHLALAGAAALASFSAGRGTTAQTGETGHPELLGDWSPGTVAGSLTCAGCHRAIAEAQVAHPMARTAATLTPEVAERWFSGERLDAAVSWRSPGPAAGERPEYRRAGTGAALVDPGGGSVAVDAVFGSGLRGVTPVAFGSDGAMRELRLSWSHGLGSWIETPGSEGDADPLGDLDSPRQMRECVACHATAVVWAGGAPHHEGSEWGVRCERCHGPGAAHAAVPDADSIRNPGRLDPAAQVAFCGGCHRTPTDFEPIEVLRRDRSLTRHAAGSLMMSACFRASPPERTISCLDCHDPHRAERSVAARSRTVCRRCHEDPAAVHAYERVTRDSDCLACHLPVREEVFPGAAFSDHWIRVPAAPGPLDVDREREEIAYLEVLYRNELVGDHDPQERARLLIGLGELLFAQGLPNTAAETLEQGLTQDPDYTRLLKAAAIFRESGRLEAAERALVRAVARKPEAVQAFFDLGELRLLSGDGDGAASAFETARRRNPDSALIRAALGAAHRVAGRLDDALTEGLAAIERNEASVRSWLELGRTRRRRRELREADDALRTAHRLDPNSPPVLDARARLLALDPNPEVRDLEEAERLAGGLAGLGGYREPRSLDLLAAVLAASGDFESALRTAGHALESAKSIGNDGLAAEIRKRIELYQRGLAWTDPGWGPRSE